jgi:hypothetical protein
MKGAFNRGLSIKIMRVLCAAPVIAATQQGCASSTSSCDGAPSPSSLEQRVPLVSADGGVPRPPTTAECQAYCNSQGAAHDSDKPCPTEPADGGLVVVCSYTVLCEGRRPDGFVPPECDAEGPALGAYFARMATMEAASVAAFEAMADELLEHGLPADLVAAARHAAAEEARHHAMTAALARRFGKTSELGVVEARRPRSLFEMAAENVREGVVRETLGAAFGHWQARHAGERIVRSVMKRIATEETSHAELSWAVDEALRARLTPAENAQLDLVRDAALNEFERAVERPAARELEARAGLPPVAVAKALVAAARAELFA